MTVAQKKARENFKKAIAYRKKTGCSLKQAFAYVKGKKVGATKVIERGEKKNAKVTKVLQRVRSKKGTFKGMKKVSGGTHKDTKSHNVNIRVVSGIKKLNDEEIKFLHSEIKNATGYNYRGKILFGQPIVLKETKNGTPIKKWVVDNLEVANILSNELNKNKKFAKLKSKKI
jgi:hypothetical protein